MGIPPLSRGASTAFRRPDNDTAQVPSAAPGLVRACFRKLFRTPSGAWRGRKLDSSVLSKGLCPKNRRQYRNLDPVAACSSRFYTQPGDPLGAQVFRPGGTRAEPAEGTSPVSTLPPERGARTPTDAPVALSGGRGVESLESWRPLPARVGFSPPGTFLVPFGVYQKEPARRCGNRRP